MSGPDFRELIGDDVPAEERARLKRAHDLLVAAGPPPELTPALETPPAPERNVAWLPRRRLGAALVLAAALVLSAFAGGFLIGDRSDDSSAVAGFEAERTVLLGESGSTVAVVRLGKADRNGNHPMLVTVEGLERQPKGDYYSLFMLKNGKPVALCGTFNVADEEATTVRLTTGYGFERYDGLMLAEYRASDHEDHPLLRASL
jgi:Anti-sigma-K factor rskA